MLPEPPALLAFLGASLLLIVTPGPAVLYLVARSIDQGRAAGLVSVAGIALGAQFQIIATAAGLSALLLQSAMTFMVIKDLGALYLIYLGIKRLLSSDELPVAGELAPRALGNVFRDAVIVSFLNPKSALFFIAFLPQFIEPARGSIAVQVVLLGGLFLLLGVCSDASTPS